MTAHLTGRIESFDPVELLQWLEVQRVSGRLTIDGSNGRCRVDWQDGEIIYVSGGRPEDQLGVTLLRSRKVPVAALYEALADNIATGAKLSRLLLESGAVSRETLAAVVEELARRLLAGIFQSRGGAFAFDPDYQTEDLLQIRLKLKAQVVAFHAVKSRDEARAASPSPDSPDAGAAEPDAQDVFRPEAVDAAFWRVEEASAAGGETASVRERFFGFRRFAAALADELARPAALEPIFDDSTALIGELLEARESAEKMFESAAGVALLDPFLTANLLRLANSLAVAEEQRVSSPSRALRRMGRPAFERMARHLLSRSKVAVRTAVHPLDRAIRRAGLAAAAAARVLAPELGVNSDEAIAIGLLYPIPFAGLVNAISATHAAAGSFRAAALESFRPAVARKLCRDWRVTRRIADAISDDGSAGADPATLCLRGARAAFPNSALGSAATQAGKPPKIPAADRRELKRVFEVLDLGAP